MFYSDICLAMLFRTVYVHVSHKIATLNSDNMQIFMSLSHSDTELVSKFMYIQKLLDIRKERKKHPLKTIGHLHI